MRKGKIKFSHTATGQKIGTKTDYFRVCQDAKNKAGDWENYPGFEPQLRELRFRFPFAKMENNIKIGYSGYCQLPMDGTANGALGSYFVASDGIGCPLVARPDGHSGKMYDGRNSSLVLTEERLAKWKMVKKRMTLFVSPEGWGPHEWIAWSTTSEVAMESVQAEYTQLERMIGQNLCMLPLTLRAVTKQFKNRDGQSTRFAFGSVGFTGSPMDLCASAQEALLIRNTLNLSAIEEDFERSGFFYIDDEEEPQQNTKETIDEETGEIKYLDENGVETQPQLSKDALEHILRGLVGETQIRTILTLSKKCNREEDVAKVASPAQALALLNSLVTQDSKERKRAA